MGKRSQRKKKYVPLVGVKNLTSHRAARKITSEFHKLLQNVCIVHNLMTYRLKTMKNKRNQGKFTKMLLFF